MPSSNSLNLTSRLYFTADEDFYRRLVTLDLEISHIIRVADFYSSSQGDPGEDTAISTIAEIKKMATMLKSSISDERIVYESSYINQINDKLVKAPENSDKQRQILQEKLIYQAYFRGRAMHYTAQIGYLNDRLGQRLESFILEDPAPLVRRAVEQDFTSEFIRRLTKNAYRDMILFLRDFLKCDIPYNSTPPTLQYWTYSESYHSDIYRDKGAKNYPKHILGRTPNRDDDNHAFNVVIMSFWNIDFPELYTILAHELAHILIKDTSGNLNPLILSNSRATGHFGKLARKLVAILDSWLPQEVYISQRVDVEIMADILATAQFGFAYLHAWFIEMLDSLHEVKHLRDQFSEFIGPENLFDDNVDLVACLKEFAPCHADMAVYLRGVAIYSLLRLTSTHLDEIEKAYLSAFKLHLENILEMRYDPLKSPHEYNLWKVIGHQIYSAVKRSGISKYICSLKRASGLMHKSFHLTPDYGHDFWHLQEQNLSNNVQDSDEFQTILGAESSERKFHPTEVPWRAIWADAQQPKKANQLVKKFCKNIGKRRSIIHTLQADYIYKTGNVIYPYILKRPGKNVKNEPSKKYSMLHKSDIRDVRKSITNTKIHYERFMATKISPSAAEKFTWEWNPTFLGEKFLVFDLLLAASPKDIVSANTPKGFDQETHSYKTGITYGRYDRFFLLDGQDYFNKAPLYHDGENPASDALPKYKVRRRIIRKMKMEHMGLSKYLNEPEDPKLIPSAMILVSLVDKSARNHFLRFMIPCIIKNFCEDKNNLCNSFNGEIYGSEGYEDFILLFYASDQTRNLKTLFDLALELCRCNVVSRTETIITKFEDAFANTSKDKILNWCSNLSASIGVRLKYNITTANYINDVKTKLESICRNSNQEITLEVLPGRIDYAIRIPDLCEEGYNLFEEIRAYLSGSKEEPNINNKNKACVARIHTQLTAPQKLTPTKVKPANQSLTRPSLNPAI